MVDEATTNLEDIIWAHKEIELGYNIIYTPTASAVHHHGLNHDDDMRRLGSSNTISCMNQYFNKSLKPNIIALK